MVSIRDKFQERYIAHQLKKKDTLLKIIKKRHSNRIFKNHEIESEKLKVIYDAISNTPSSCNRHGLEYHEVTGRDEKNFLSGVLVGAVGWAHRADRILLLFGRRESYKEDLDFMPYLDAGIIVQQVYLVTAALEIGCCYINPNIRKRYLDYFKSEYAREVTSEYGPDYFCGALALGYLEK